MIPWVLLDKVQIPGDGGELSLHQRGDEFSIRLEDGNELMNSRLGGSEEALATFALDSLAGRPAPKVLIGGLGMGFTLRAALAVAPHHPAANGRWDSLAGAARGRIGGSFGPHVGA